MADGEVNLKVNLQTRLEEAKDLTKTIGDKGGFPDGKRRAQIEATTKTIEALLQNFNPSSNAQLSKINAEFGKLTALLGKGALEISHASETLKKLNSELAKLKEQQDVIRGRKDAKEAAHGGKFKDGSFHYFKNSKELKDFVSGADVHNARGAKITNYDVLRSKVDAANTSGSYEGQFKTQGDYERAQNALRRIDEAEQKVGKELSDLAKQIEDFQAKIQNKAAEVKAQQVKETVAPEYGASQQIGQSIEAMTGARREENTNRNNQETTAVDPLEKQSSTLGKAFRAFSIYAIGVRTARKALREAILTVKDLDKYLTEQAMVTGKTRQETYKLLKEYQNMSAALGATTKEVAEVATQFMRQGKTAEDALTLTNAAISAAKVAGISATESVNYLTTALNGFQLSAEDAMAVSDKFASIAAQSATSYEEIATALSKVAAQANLAGMSIDYTTALLAKGIETTREAPETIGTALKTVIARMRELSDYGETLQGDTDINNVESQLAYVGIALRDNNGELRSTEEVLNELGGKWDTLNSNQQAAIAKALAGTRQQSRLIAMMTDYERVIELQEIAQRSQGATVAQMATYMEGMEAALNKVSVAWESIVTAVTDSEVIINVIDAVSGLMNMVASILSNSAMMVGIMTVLGVLALNLLGTKMLEWKLAKQQRDLDAQKQRYEVQSELAAKRQLALEALKKKEIAEQTKLAEIKGKLEKGQNLTLEEQRILNESITDADDKRYQNIGTSLGMLQDQNLLLSDMSVLTGAVGGAFGLIASSLIVIKPLMLFILGIQKLINAAKAKEGGLTLKNIGLTMKEAMAKKIAAAFGMANSASAIPYVGWVIGGAILSALLGVAIAGGIAAANYYKKTSTSEGVADQVNALSNQVYQLNKQAQALDTVVAKFDDLDNKVLKTNQDLKEMNELLDSAADDLGNDDVDDKEDEGYGKGISQREYYESLQSDKERRKFLEEEAEKDREKARDLQRQQLELIQDLRRNNPAEFSDFMNGSSADARTARDAIYAINNQNLYDYIDGLKELQGADKEALTATEELTKAIIEEMTAEEALKYAEKPELLEQLTDTLASLRSTVTNSDGTTSRVSIASIMTSDDYSIKDKTEAFKELQEALEGDAEALNAVNELYNEFIRFAEMDDEVLEFIDEMGISVDKLNDFSAAWSTLKKSALSDVMTEAEYKGTFDAALSVLARTGGDVSQTIKEIYGDFLKNLDQGTEAYEEAYNALVNVMDSMLGKTLLDVGQNMDKIANSVSSIYEKANKWNTMSDSDKTQFLTDNAALFEGESGALLLRAFETGNYDLIKQALQGNEALVSQIENQLRNVRTKIQIEEARVGEDRNEAYIKYLKDLESTLMDADAMYEASLEDRLNKEKSQLDIYKEYLQKQQEALTDSLDKRKEAYQKYFDAVNQEEEDEDYEEEASLLVANLTKLGTSTDQASIKQAKELENRLEELEEERLKKLRERAQEAVLSNIDDQIDKISSQFDELLKTDADILAALKMELNNNPDFISQLLSANLAGMTELQAQDYIQNTFTNAFGSAADLSSVEISKNEAGDTILNVAGQTINLSQADSDALSSEIYAALRRLGITI